MKSCAPFVMSPPSCSIECSGFTRPPNPVCGPLASNGMASERTLPCRTRLAAALILAGVMKFTVPSSSVTPQRPQFRYLRARARTVSMLIGSAMGLTSSRERLPESSYREKTRASLAAEGGDGLREARDAGRDRAHGERTVAEQQPERRGRRLVVWRHGIDADAERRGTRGEIAPHARRQPAQPRDHVQSGIGADDRDGVTEVGVQRP